MATFEAHDASPPNATEATSAPIMWPLFFATNATATAGVIDAANARARRHITHEPGEHTKRRAT